ncbi:hypothetical protein F4859DRAFT_397633 [Xylaria cf. heliscus]|nr:hypothetical protein F4859DRAFT_397633 [Xylaria cf. heliscus]
MFPIPVINRRAGVRLHPQPTLQEFRLQLFKRRKNLIELLLSLPPELRIAIYELIAPTDRIPIGKWRMPGLAQVNRQLRNEVIPAYFGKAGGFKLLLEYGRHQRQWDLVRLFCQHFSPHLRYIKQLDVQIRYDGMHRNQWGVMLLQRVKVGMSFVFSRDRVGVVVGEGRRIKGRVGNDETDWDDDVDAACAFEECEVMHNGDRFLCWPINSNYPSFSSDLCLLAKHAKLANRQVYLLYNEEAKAISVETIGRICIDDLVWDLPSSEERNCRGFTKR